MRDYALLVAVACLLPVILFRPYLGILTWTCFALMNPHRETWGIAQTVHLSVLIGATTIVASIREIVSRWFPWNREMFLLLALWAMYSLATVFATYPDLAWAKYDRIWKILLMVVLTTWIVDTKKRLMGLIYVSAFSVGIYGIGGGIFSILTAGRYRVYGPEASFLADNNALALALNMTLPFFFFLAYDTRSKFLRILLMTSFFLTIIAIVFTYSRGGLLGLIAVLGLILLKSGGRYRFLLLAALASAPLFLPLVPQQWKDRMGTIETYEGDRSAMSRIYAWRLAWRIAVDNPMLGGGLQVMEDKSLYDRYYPESPTRGDVHSVYFEILSETGFINFGIFSLLMLSCLATARRLGKQARGYPQMHWVTTCSSIAEIALIGYLVSGAFQELATFDYVYLIIGIIIILKSLVKRSESFRDPPNGQSGSSEDNGLHFTAPTVESLQSLSLPHSQFVPAEAQVG